jgi:hypothetical protein
MILLRQFLVWSIPLWLTAFAVAAFAADAKPGWQGDWERTLGAAEKEGEVAVAIYDQGPVTAAVVDAFQKTFPKINVNSLRARGSQIGPKIIAERRAEKYLIDLFTAAKVFVNWLLSRDAQTLMQKSDGSDSLRVDIPKDSVLAENRRLAGAEYLDGDDPKFSDRRPADKLLNEILK